MVGQEVDGCEEECEKKKVDVCSNDLRLSSRLLAREGNETYE